MDEYRIQDLKYHKNFPIYLKVYHNFYLKRFFSSISNNYDSIKDKYLEDFRQEIAHYRLEYLKKEDNLRKQQEKLNQLDIKIHYSSNSSSGLYLIGGNSFGDIIFQDEAGYTIKLSNDDIEFMKSYMEENQNSNIEKVIISKAEIEYNNSKEEKLSLLKQKKKELKILKFLTNGNMPLDESFKSLRQISEKHNNKFLEITKRLWELELLQQKVKFFQKLRYFEIEAILDVYNMYIEYVETYNKFSFLKRKRDNNEVENEIYDIALAKTLEDLTISEDAKNNISYQLYKAICSNEMACSPYWFLYAENARFSYSFKNAIDWYHEFHSSKLSDEQIAQFRKKEYLENEKRLFKSLRYEKTTSSSVKEYFF